MAISMASHRPFLVCLFFSALLVVSAIKLSVAQPANAVLDNDGDEVRIDSQYQINKEGFGFFGGLTTLPLPNTTACARNIGLGEETDPGRPTLFTPGIPSQASSGVLRLGIRSKIAFRPIIAPAICAERGVWTTQANSSGTDGGLLTAIVAGRELDTNSTSAWFEVRPTRKARVYKLVYCPCLPCRIICTQPVGFVGGVLGFGGSSFTFRFFKATDNLALAAV